MKKREDLTKLRLAELRGEIALGIVQADRGNFVDGPRTFAGIRQKSMKQTSRTSGKR